MKKFAIVASIAIMFVLINYENWQLAVAIIGFGAVAASWATRYQ